jgi:hypothetical protein
MGTKKMKGLLAHLQPAFKFQQAKPDQPGHMNAEENNQDSPNDAYPILVLVYGGTHK